MEPLPVYILAGGQSSRFGSDKALAIRDGLPLIARIARAVGPIASSVTVVAKRADQYAPLRTIPDLMPHLGPMGGLETALEDAGASDWIVVLSCDLLDLNPEWIRSLASCRTGDAKAVAFRPDYWQPLLALYRLTILPTVRQHIADDNRRMQSLLNAVHAIAAPLPADWPAVLQANSREDFERAARPPRS